MKKIFPCSINLIFPGVGFALTGRVALCAVFIATYFISITLFIWTRSIFSPTAILAFCLYLISLHILAGVSTIFINNTTSNKSLVFLAFIAWWLLFGIMIIFRESAFGWAIYHIPSGSMKPTLKPGDIILVDTWSYNDQSPQAGDVIVFSKTQEKPAVFVKRVHALPDELEPDLQGFYVLGDNLAFSTDSRQFGLVDPALVKGQAKIILLGRQGWVDKAIK